MLYQISFEKDGIYQVNLATAPSAEKALHGYQRANPDSRIFGIAEIRLGNVKPGMPVWNFS